jgi:hypothetical protein
VQETGARLFSVHQEHAVVDVTHWVEVGPARFYSKHRRHVGSLRQIAGEIE